MLRAGLLLAGLMGLNVTWADAQTAVSRPAAVRRVDIERPLEVQYRGQRDVAYPAESQEGILQTSSGPRRVLLQNYDYLCPDYCKFGTDFVLRRLFLMGSEPLRLAWEGVHWGPVKLISSGSTGYAYWTDKQGEDHLMWFDGSAFRDLPSTHPAWADAYRGKALLEIQFDSRLDGNLAARPEVFTVLKRGGFENLLYGAVTYHRTSATSTQLVWNPNPPRNERSLFVGPFDYCTSLDPVVNGIEAALRKGLGFVHPLIGCRQLSP
jgi:hypothetical protein